MFFKSIKDECLNDIMVPSLFFDMYLATATGNQIKVYLLGYKSAYLYNGNKEDGVDNSSIAMALSMTKKEVEDAWRYWRDKGVVEIYESEEYFSVKFLDIKYEYMKKHYNSIIENEEVDEFEENMFLDIESLIGRPLVPNEKISIEGYRKNYKMSGQMVVEAFRTAINETGSIKSISYIGAILKNWYDNSIWDKNDLSRHKEKHEERNSNYKIIFKALGFNRYPTEEEKQRIDTWIDDYNMSMDVIHYALKKSVGINNPTIAYFDKIISTWYEKGIKTLQEAENYDKNYNKDKKEYNFKGNIKKGSPQYKTKFHNFKPSESEQYSDENLRRLMKAGIQKD